MLQSLPDAAVIPGYLGPRSFANVSVSLSVYPFLLASAKGMLHCMCTCSETFSLVQVLPMPRALVKSSEFRGVAAVAWPMLNASRPGGMAPKPLMALSVQRHVLLPNP